MVYIVRYENAHGVEFAVFPPYSTYEEAQIEAIERSVEFGPAKLETWDGEDMVSTEDFVA